MGEDDNKLYCISSKRYNHTLAPLILTNKSSNWQSQLRSIHASSFTFHIKKRRTVARLVLSILVLNEVICSGQTHPGPPFEKGGRNTRWRKGIKRMQKNRALG